MGIGKGLTDEVRPETLLDGVSAVDVLDAASDAILFVDTDGTIVAVNQATIAVFGRDRSDLVGRPIESLVPAPMREAHQRTRQSYTTDPQPRPMGAGLALLAQRSDDSTFPVDIALSPIKISGQNYVMASVRDVSENVAARDELERTQQRAALTEDRERVARDLHDTVIQRVFAVGLSLQSIIGRAEDAAVAGRIRHAVDDLDEVIRDIRTAIFGLGSHQDWGRGLRGEVLRVAADHAPALGFEPGLSFSGAIDDIGAPLAEQLLPTLREALSNVAKHAHARRCQVTMAVEGGYVELVVADDGVGPDQPRGKRGRGLINLASRANSLGGQCELLPGSPTGSRLEWRAPLTQP